jgi:hypothetical protein
MSRPLSITFSNFSEPVSCPAPSVGITVTPSVVSRNGTGQASVPDTPGATYAWTISAGGTITAGAGTRTITFSAGCNVSSVIVSVVVTAACGTVASDAKTVSTGPLPSATLTVDGSSTISQGQSKTIHVALTGTPPWTVTWSDGGSQWNGSATTFDRSVTPLSTTSYTATVTDSTGCSSISSGLTITVTLPTPSGLTATAISPTQGSLAQVSLGWTFSGSADSYEIERRAPGGSFVLHGTSDTTAFIGEAAANTAYLYRVRAKKASTFSAWSNIDLATTVIFTDPSLEQFVSAYHITELRTAINAVRSLAGWTPAGFTDANPSGVEWKAVHITELRNALNAARSSLLLPDVNYSDDSVSLVGLLFKATYINELRGGVR